jgi:hypothetical protein
MTLKEFLETISFHHDNCKNENCENLNNQILEYNISIQHNENFATSDNGETILNAIDIDNNLKLITLKTIFPKERFTKQND